MEQQLILLFKLENKDLVLEAVSEFLSPGGLWNLGDKQYTILWEREGLRGLWGLNNRPSALT